MAKRPSLKSINRLRFLHNNDERKQKIEAAPPPHRSRRNFR